MHITSDGYYSLFGGKRMMKTAFKDKLQNLFNLPIDKQKEYSKIEFLKCKGDEPQVDDVIVVGIELE